RGSPAADASHGALYDAQPSAGPGRSCLVRTALRRAPSQRRRLRPRLRGGRGSGESEGALFGRRALVGRGREHALLDRSVGGAHRDLPHAAAPIDDVSLPSVAGPSARLSGARRVTGAATMPPFASELQERLVPLFGPAIAIERLTLLAGGASKEAW